MWFVRNLKWGFLNVLYFENFNSFLVRFEMYKLFQYWKIPLATYMYVCVIGIFLPKHNEKNSVHWCVQWKLAFKFLMIAFLYNRIFLQIGKVIYLLEVICWRQFSLTVSKKLLKYRKGWNKIRKIYILIGFFSYLESGDTIRLTCKWSPILLLVLTICNLQ